MTTEKRPPVELDERSVQNALFAIGQPENWEELVKVGTAVKAAIGDNGRAMFVQWAENSPWGNSNPKREKRHNFSNNFNGFNTQKVGSGTLIWLANKRTGGEFSRQNAKGDFQQTPEYLASQAIKRKEIAARQTEANHAIATKNAQTVQNIQKWFAPTALPAKITHPYLRKKGFTDIPHGVTYYANRIQIPLHDKDGNIIAAQAIHGNPPEGMPQKQAYGSFKGASFVFGDINQSEKKGVIMAEGFATAYSLHKATGLPAIMAVSSSNFDDVAAVYREKMPDGIPFIIAADNDKNQVGMKAAKKAAEVYGKDAVIQMVEFDEATQSKFQHQTGSNPTDYNDLALYGSYADVKTQIDKAIETHKQQQTQIPTPQPPQQEKNIMTNDNVNLNSNNLAVQGQKHTNTEQHEARVIEPPTALETSVTNDTVSVKETKLQHFRENMEQVRENNEAQTSAEFLEEIQAMETSWFPVEELQEEPIENEDGTNSVEKTSELVQSSEFQKITERAHQKNVYHAYLEGTLQKEFEKLSENMELAETPETFREHYTEFNRMRNAIMEIDANDTMKKELGNEDEGSLKEQDGVKWAKLTAAIAAGTYIAHKKAQTDDIFQAAFEDGQKRAKQFRPDKAPVIEPQEEQKTEPEQPQLKTITEEEILRNLNRSKGEQKTEHVQRDQPKKSDTELPPEKTLSIEQPQIKLPREVTDIYLVNRDKTELYNERTGETQIYINSEKNQLKTKHQDFETVETMVKIAEKNQWSSITIRGTPEFRKLAWEMASIQGIEVKGYKPTQQEIKVMEARKARIDEMKATNHIEGNTQTQSQAQPKQSGEKEQPEQTRHIRHQTDLPQIYYDKMNAGFGAGTVTKIGSKVHPLSNDPNDRQTPFIELETASGSRHTIWGVGLKELIDQRNINIGERVALRVNGTETKTWVDKTGIERSGERKRWVIEDLVQQNRENQTQGIKREQQKQTTTKLSAASMFLAGVAEAVKRGEKVTAYQQPEQAKIQPKKSNEETQTQSKEQKQPRMISR